MGLSKGWDGGEIEAHQTVATAPFGEKEAGESQGRSEVGRYQGCNSPEVRDERDSTGSSLCPRERVNRPQT